MQGVGRAYHSELYLNLETEKSPSRKCVSVTIGLCYQKIQHDTGLHETEVDFSPGRSLEAGAL